MHITLTGSSTTEAQTSDKMTLIVNKSQGTVSSQLIAVQKSLMSMRLSVTSAAAASDHAQMPSQLSLDCEQQANHQAPPSPAAQFHEAPQASFALSAVLNICPLASQLGFLSALPASPLYPNDDSSGSTVTP